MKKLFIALFAFLGLLYINPLNVMAVEYKETWINCGAHYYNEWDNPFLRYSTFDNESYDPNRGFLEDSSKGIVISYNPQTSNANNWGFRQIYYFSFSNSAIGNFNTTSNPPSLSSCITGSGTTLPSPFESLSTNGRTVYWAYYQGNGLWDKNVKADLFVTSGADLYNQLEAMGFDTKGIAPPDPNAINSDLPMLTYRTNSKSMYKFPNSFQVKGTFEWDYTQYPIYSQNPTDFVMDITASVTLDSGGFPDLSTPNQPINTDHEITVTKGGCVVSMNEYSFSYQDIGLKVYQTYGYNKFPLHENAQSMADGYLVYIRTRQLSTNLVSAWKLFYFQGGQFQPAGYAEDSNGTVKPLPEDDRDPENSSPLAPYTSDNSTSTESDPTSDNFQGTDNYDPSAVIFNLKSTISAIGDIPAMLGQAIVFLPAWLISLIAVSLGLVVIVGVVKLILR